jgi:hypothetical protein
MPTTSLYLASPCYGGVAQARYMRSLLALRIACGQRNIPIQFDLGGGEALVSRARAGMTARFLGSQASHLLFADAGATFSPQAVFALLDSGAEVGSSQAEGAAQPTLLLIGRAAARKVCDAFPELEAGLGDVRNAGAARAAMVFESVIEPGTGRYLPDLQAFVRRWRDLGGQVWTGPGAREPV